MKHRRRRRVRRATLGSIPTEPNQKRSRVSESSAAPIELHNQLHRALLGLGPLERAAAIRSAAAALRDAGTVEYRRLRRDGPLYRSLDAAVNAAIAADLLDEPTSTEVRAVLKNARDYALEHWRRVVLSCIGEELVDRTEAIEASAYWAAENMGLEFQRLRRDGVIVRGLEAAIDAAIQRGDIESVERSKIRRVLEG